ncbi:MAG TPA: hypothetical protein VGZ29_04920 [Terriglobia bacterium]|nr:hypothetical protein [Terriglobia bacterium]
MRFLSKCLKITGYVTFFGMFLANLVLITYWRAVRPHISQAASGWTRLLPWGLGAYGTVGEARFLTNSFDFYLPAAFLLVIASALIDFFKFGVWPLKRSPKRQIWK